MTLTNTTSAGTNNFDISATTTNNCLVTAATRDLVYALVVPANSTVVVTASATWDMVLNAVAAPASNCGVFVGGATQGITCASGSDGTSGTETLVLTNTATTETTYFLIVDGYSSPDEGSFQIKADLVVRPSGPTEIEPNDTRVLADATGQTLTSGTAMNAELAVSEADLFRINIATAGVLRVEVNSYGCQDFGTIRFGLLDSTATQLSADDTTTSFACRVMVAQVQPGTYYLSMTRTATGSQPLPYWLTPTLITARGVESEVNDTTNQANLVTGTDFVMCGALNSTTDLTDTFIFTLASPATLRAEVIETSTTGTTCESLGLDSRLELLSGAGITLRSDNTSGRGLCSRLDTPTALQPGTYFLRVTEASTTKSGFAYCLNARLR